MLPDAERGQNIIFAGLGLALSWYELPFWQGLIWAAVYGFWVSLMPILFVAYRLRMGKISDLHMNTTQERRLPYVVSVTGALIALAIMVGASVSPPGALLMGILAASLMWQVRERATGSTELGVG